MLAFLFLVLNAPLPLPPPVGPVLHPPICKAKASDLTRDQRRDIILLHSIGWSYAQIRRQTGFTVAQIGRACRADRPTPQKRNSRPPILF